MSNLIDPKEPGEEEAAILTRPVSLSCLRTSG